jgi:hypothetical protein
LRVLRPLSLSLVLSLSLCPSHGKIWELEGDFDSESESWDSAPQAPRSKETGAPQARGTLADLGFLVRVWRVKAVFFFGFLPLSE